MANNQNAPVIMASIDIAEMSNGDIWYEVNCWRSSGDCFSMGYYASRFTAMTDAFNIGVPVVSRMNSTTRNQWIDRIERGMTNVDKVQ